MSGFISKNIILSGLGGLLVGALIILGIRFFAYSPADGVHYHANFAVFINGQREQFKDFSYYVDTEGVCSLEEKKMTPYERAHMHGYVGDVVHIEHEAVTWGQFFQNIGWVVDPLVIRTPDQILLENAQNKISFILNGKAVDSIVNRVVGDMDRLLVDYGRSSGQVLQTEYESIASTAAKYNSTKDPASCGGLEPSTWRNRMEHMF